MPGDCQSAGGGEVRCPDECTITRLRNLVTVLKDRVEGSGDQSCPKPLRDVCCERTFRIRPSSQYRVTLDGKVIEPLPESRQKPFVFCPPCESPRPPRDQRQGCYRHPKAGGSSCPTERRGMSESKTYAKTPRGPGDGGQTCAGRSTHSVCSPFACPPGHRHWSPECTDCAYPNACRADCTKHPVYKDWTYRQPSYRFYLQKRDDRPFMVGY